MGAIGLAVVTVVADGANAAEAGQRNVDVVQVSGWIDPVMADFLRDAVESAEDTDAEALVVQLDSPGALVGDAELEALAVELEQSRVPVAVWVGGSGARALRGAGRLVQAADVAGMAPRTKVEVGRDRLGPAEALRGGFVDLNVEQSAVLGNFLRAIDGRPGAGHAIDTATFTPRKGGPPVADLHPDLRVRLAKLDLVARVMHTVASPPVAYLLLTAAFGLIVFELFTAGIGIAGAVGAGALVLAAYGLGVLPTSPWGLALLVLGAFGFAVDVQTGVPRFWTAVGVVSYAAGSLFLFRDPVSLGWIPLVGAVVGITLLMLAGLPATVRSRFSTPTIGRESMVGEEGDVVADLSPEGVVRVREALWPAHTSRQTPLAVGDRVRVVAVVGPALEVAPAE